MLTVDRETFERLCYLLLNVGGVDAKEHVHDILSLLGLQAPEQASRARRPTMTEPTDEMADAACARAFQRSERSLTDAWKCGYSAGVTSQAERIAELEGERDSAITEQSYSQQLADEIRAVFRKHNLAAGPTAVDRLVEQRDTLTRELADAKARAERAEKRHERCVEASDKTEKELAEAKYDLARYRENWRITNSELAEAKEELRRIGDAWERYQREDLSQEEFEGTVAEAVEPGHRSAKTSAGEGARDDGPPRVGDVVRLNNIGADYEVLRVDEASSGPYKYQLNTPTRHWFHGSALTIIRRAGQPEAQTGDLAAKTGGLAEQTGGLPGEPGPNTDRLAELKRKVAILWDEHINTSRSGNP